MKSSKQKHSGRENLPYLLNLLDDESSVVREAVIRELERFGPTLGEELNQLEREPTVDQVDLMRQLLKPDLHWLSENWDCWKTIPHPYQRLEAALNFLARFQNRIATADLLPGLLDELVVPYRLAHPVADPFTLAAFLGRDAGFRGNKKNYYATQNSNLIQVIEKRQGQPISLACIYMLAGHRLGLEIHGCNNPGHFLAQVTHKGQLFLIDCFNNWQIFNIAEILNREDAVSLRLLALVKSEATPETIIKRMLLNLKKAFEEEGDASAAGVMLELSQQV